MDFNTLKATIKKYQAQYKGYTTWDHCIMDKWEFELLKDQKIISTNGVISPGGYRNVRNKLKAACYAITEERERIQSLQLNQ